MTLRPKAVAKIHFYSGREGRSETKAEGRTPGRFTRSKVPTVSSGLSLGAPRTSPAFVIESEIVWEITFLKSYFNFDGTRPVHKWVRGGRRQTEFEAAVNLNSPQIWGFIFREFRIYVIFNGAMSCKRRTRLAKSLNIYSKTG